MPLPRWALALADDNGRSGSTDAALASVISLPHLDERVLVAEAQTGSRAAFEELVRRYDRDVLRLALNLMKRPEDARDVYQEAFLKVYRNLQLLHLALPHRHQRLLGPFAPPPGAP